MKKALKYIMIALAVLFVISLFVPKPDIEEPCDFLRVQVTRYEVGTDKVLSDVIYSGCYRTKTIDEQLGLIEISSDSNLFKIQFYLESDPNILRYLNIYADGQDEPEKWRREEGHDILINQTPEFMAFVFGETNGLKTKGVVKFFR